MDAPHPDPRVRRVVERFEAFAPADLPRLGELYAPDARFRDPFHAVQGLPAITRVYAHMFETLDEPRFAIHEAVAEGDRCFLTWDFHFRMRRFRREAQCIHGGSHLRFAADGRIAVHRDYWDAAEELYEKLPVLGVLMRALRRSAAA